MLSYLPRTRTRHEYITLTPEGFRFRQQVFETVPSLFRWFKDHFRDPVPQTPRAAAAARTPFTPGTGFNINSERAAGRGRQGTGPGTGQLPVRHRSSAAD